MSRTQGSTNETVFDTYKSTHISLSPIENLMIAVYEQAVTDLNLLIKSGSDQLDRTGISFSDVYNFFDKSYYNEYMSVNGKEIYNLAVADLIRNGYVNEAQVEEMEDKAIENGVKADRIALDRYARQSSLTKIERNEYKELAESLSKEDGMSDRVG